MKTILILLTAIITLSVQAEPLYFFPGIDVPTEKEPVVKFPLKVVIYPDVVRENARWRVRGKDSWWNSGDKVLLTAGKTYVIDFSHNVPGYKAPPSKLVYVHFQQTTGVTAAYTKIAK